MSNIMNVWTSVDHRLTDGYREYKGVQQWMDENIDGLYACYESQGFAIIYFEIEADAVAFKLRWM